MKYCDLEFCGKVQCDECDVCLRDDKAYIWKNNVLCEHCVLTALHIGEINQPLITVAQRKESECIDKARVHSHSDLPLCFHDELTTAIEPSENAVQWENNTMVMVKVAPMGEVVVEVNVEQGTTVQQVLDIAGVEENGRAITVNNVPATGNTVITEGAVVSLANKMKGGMNLR